MFSSGILTCDLGTDSVPQLATKKHSVPNLYLYQLIYTQRCVTVNTEFGEGALGLFSSHLVIFASEKNP